MHSILTQTAIHPTPLAARHYTHFRVGERLLLTGHSHQAWPDVAHRGQRRAWDEAAALVDDKWSRGAAVADEVRLAWRSLLDDRSGEIALGASTHELMIRLLSALSFRTRPKIVTTDGEFHTIRRQIDRMCEMGGLAEAPGTSPNGLQLVRVPADPVDAISERLIAAIDDTTAVVLVSAVLFRNARIVPGLDAVARACANAGCPLVVDAYHAVNVIPFRLAAHGLEEHAFVVGGGYKYCQLGEGNCFLRIPPAWMHLRPGVTGWFAEWDLLETQQTPGEVSWSKSPAIRFAGATYDPTSHYRAAEVFRFFAREGLTPEVLREVSRHQIARLANQFDALDLDPAVICRDRSINLADVAGFLALETPHAGTFVARLRDRGMLTDSRGDVLRLGPAPYLSDHQLDQAMDLLGKVAREIGSS